MHYIFFTKEPLIIERCKIISKIIYISGVIITFGLFLLLPPPVSACHIVDVDAVYDCDGYTVTVWAWVHSGYELSMELELRQGPYDYGKFLHYTKFEQGGENVKTVFSGSWGDTLCGDYNVERNIHLYNLCKSVIDSEYNYATINCNCFECYDDADCDDGDLCNGSETCVNNHCVDEILGVACGVCDGKVTQLTLRYLGVSTAYIEVIQKDQQLVFEGMIQSGDTFTFSGMDLKGTLGTEISIFVDGYLNTKIHTSCSNPIGPGLVSGDFEVVEGYSRNGGLLCPLYIDCDDGNICTNDWCDPQAGCQYTNNNSSCDDSSVCTEGDYCSDGACQGGIPITCDDGDGCTTDTCDSLSGCVFTPIQGCECDEDSDR
jgi:hypothetical protein